MNSDSSKHMEARSTEAFWIQRAYEEASENIQRKHQHGTGICSVFILDTSESMAGDGVRQMKKALLDILDEYISLNLDDNIAVIGCGKEVKFLHYYSNNYSSIKKCLDVIHCEGPSPLEAGIILSYSCLTLGGGHTAIIPPLYIRARVVVISDGNPTDLDISSSMETGGTTTHSEAILKELAVATRGGRLIGWKNARQYARLSLCFNIAGNILERFPDETITESIVMQEYFDCGVGSKEDVIQICEILNEREVYRDDVDIAEDNYKERYSNMPCVGTRVRRGRHWRYDNQDSYGVGTVIGHSKHVGWLHVEWDNGKKVAHQFGYDGINEKYDLHICHEPRHIPENYQIATGCLVRKGLDWRWGNQNGSEDSIGTVYRTISTGEVYVRWPNGNKSNYRFGYKDRYDLVMCDPRDPEVDASYKLQLKMYNQEKRKKSAD